MSFQPPGMPPGPQPPPPPPPLPVPGGAALPGPSPAGLPPGVPPAIAQVVLHLAAVLDVPPEVVLLTMLALLRQHGPPAVAAFVGAPPAMQAQIIREFGPPQPGPPPGLAHPVPPPGAPIGPAGGVPSSPSPGLAGPPHLAGGPVPLPPPGLPPHPALPPDMQRPHAPSQLRAKPKPAPEPPEDWEPPNIREIARASRYGKRPPTRDQVIRDALRHRMVWTPRDKAILRQVNKYARVDDRLDAFGNPIDPAGGGMYFKLSRATTTVDRLIGDALPTTSTIVTDLPARAADQETRASAQACENILRSWEEQDEIEWDGLSSQGVIATHLPRKRIGMMALMGAQCCAFRLMPANREHLVYKEPIALSEVYPGALSTTRQSYLSFDEACALYPEILDRLTDAGYDESDPARRFGVGPQTVIRVIGWSDKDGLWRCVTWDWGSASGLDEVLVNVAKDEDAWIVAPVRIDYGFCYYQVGTYWNGPPQSAMQSTQDYSEQAARGALYAHVDTFEEMDKIASALKTNFMSNLHPAYVRESSEPEAKEGTPVLTGINEVNDIEIGGKIYPLYINATGTPDGAATMAIMAGELADVANPVQAGKAPATSGSDRAQIAEQAGNLHLDQLKEGYCADMRRWHMLTLTLAYRLGSGRKKVWKTLPYRQFKGGDAGAEGTLKIEDIKRAGARVVVSYHDEDLAAEQQKNQVYLERLKADVLSLRTVRGKLGSDDPDAEGEQVVEDKIIDANPKLQDALSQEALRHLDYSLYLAYVQSQAAGPGQGGGGGGGGQMGSAPGGMPHLAGAPGVPMPGVPMPGMAPPPGMGGLPPGLG